MKKLNRKGFTLIELLAVIVVLAIIMVIATIQINKTIKKSRENAFDLAFENLKKEIKQRKIITYINTFNLLSKKKELLHESDLTPVK